MRFSPLTMVLGLTSFMTACGDHETKSSLEGAELIQDVRLTSYELKEAKWNVGITFDSGVEESLQKTSNFGAGVSKDRIERIFDEGRFVLVSNDQKLGVAVTPDGKFKDERDFSQNFADGCKITGGAKLSGSATHIRLHMVWDWSANLEGSGCPQSAQEQFGAFIQEELNRLNLKSASDLFVALDQSAATAKSLSLKLELTGEINPEKTPTVNP